MAEIVLNGTPSGYKFTSDTLHLTPGYNIVSQSMYPVYRVINPTEGTHYDFGYDFDDRQRGRVIYNSPTKSDTVYFNTPSDWIDYNHGWMPIGAAADQKSAKKEFYKMALKAKPENEERDTKAHEKVLTEKKSIGGTMNRINYFQKGGAAPQLNIQQQVVALVQAAMQGDQKATETVNKIMQAAEQGDQQAMQLAQMIQQVVKQMQGQATSAKWGSKLRYIQSLKYARGGKACADCDAPAKVEEKACGGKAKKTKKRYFGGWL